MHSDDFLKVEELSPTSSSPMLSPTLSAITPSSLSNHGPNRRPSRKSTLTQQQKNQKRQRATQDQLTTLEIEFSRNPTPTASVRERIAQEINMTERSVQIWFQNRRAKIKNRAKKSIETGEECDDIPESMRKYLAMQALESGKPFLRADMHHGGTPGYGSGLLMSTDAAASKVMITHLTCRSLAIGSWRRIGQTNLDLVVFYSPTKSMMTYYIQADGSGFRIEYPFSSIKNITLDSGDVSASAEGALHQSGGLIVELNRPPVFTMDQGSGGWFQCRDFTEDQQASQVMVHHLGGHPKVLSGQLAKFVSSEAFQNRHSALSTNSTHLSVPVDPIGFRPVSQPNHLVHPRANSFANHAFDLGFPPSRGHKRQRSRSVPVAVDFSQLRPSKAPFIVHRHHHTIMPQHHHIYTHLPASAPQVHAPVPQYIPHPHQGFPTLTLDTASGYGMDIPSSSMSTTSGTSPSSEFESYLLPTDQASDSFAASHMNTPFTNPFLSPLPEHPHAQHPDTSPLSIHSHSELLNMVAPDHVSPLHRSASAIARPTYYGAEPEVYGHEILPPVPQLYRSASTSAHPSCYGTEDGKLDETMFAHSAKPEPSPTALETFAARNHAVANHSAAQFAADMADSQKWFAAEERAIMTKKQFMADTDALLLQEDLLYDSYLTDPFGDPFLDTLADLQRHQRSKPSLSSLPFRSMGMDTSLSMLPPLPPPTPMEEYSFSDEYGYSAGPLMASHG